MVGVGVGVDRDPLCCLIVTVAGVFPITTFPCSPMPAICVASSKEIRASPSVFA